MLDLRYTRWDIEQLIGVWLNIMWKELILITRLHNVLNSLTSAAPVRGTVCQVLNMLHLLLLWLLTLQSTTLTLFFILPFRHKRVRGHQRQGPVVSERSVQQHRGVLQVHVFSGLRGFCQTTQLHSGDPGIGAQENRKLTDRWAPPTSSCSPFSPWARGWH